MSSSSALRRSTPQISESTSATTGESHCQQMLKTSARISVEGATLLIVSREQAYLRRACLPVCGNKPADGGFLIVEEEDEGSCWRKNPAQRSFSARCSVQKSICNSDARWCLWLEDASPDDILATSGRRKRVFKESGNFALRARRSPRAARPRNPDLLCRDPPAEEKIFVVPQHTSENRRYVTFGYFHPSVILHNSCSCIPDATPYHFGVFSSAMHMAWVPSCCGRSSRITGTRRDSCTTIIPGRRTRARNSGRR